ncbi:cleavage and polyadenylation specificity factor [Culex quinquefasciatus]|uniref:Cleavage and polyadenylation specificity factor n=1 Tax=Culex quinquefasciatus TaxID=7176 RepID=B0WSB9_CULQU|nr:cleavage and polyadenylation specificity factor [Culex quinquefasciatus]|eukprot:XP_001851682.1 cleavage and polyadenylation specificity factor [Culex quinquefasciatus]
MFLRIGLGCGFVVFVAFESPKLCNKEISRKIRRAVASGRRTAKNAEPPDSKRWRIVHGPLVMKDNKWFQPSRDPVKIDKPDPESRTIEELYNLLNERLAGWTITMVENGNGRYNQYTLPRKIM